MISFATAAMRYLVRASYAKGLRETFKDGAISINRMDLDPLFLSGGISGIPITGIVLSDHVLISGCI